MVNTYACKKSNAGFERIHEEQQEEPCDCRQTRNDVHLEDGGLQEDGGCQRNTARTIWPASMLP